MSLVNVLGEIYLLRRIRGERAIILRLLVMGASRQPDLGRYIVPPLINYPLSGPLPGIDGEISRLLSMRYDGVKVASQRPYCSLLSVVCFSLDTEQQKSRCWVER